MPEYITNRAGKVIGRLDQDKIYDRGGKFLGRHNPQENRTYDRTGKFVGQGDQRTKLVVDK